MAEKDNPEEKACLNQLLWGFDTVLIAEGIGPKGLYRAENQQNRMGSREKGFRLVHRELDLVSVQDVRMDLVSESEGRSNYVTRLWRSKLKLWARARWKLDLRASPQG